MTTHLAIAEVSQRNPSTFHSIYINRGTAYETRGNFSSGKDFDRIPGGVIERDRCSATASEKKLAEAALKNVATK